MTTVAGSPGILAAADQLTSAAGEAPPVEASPAGVSNTAVDSPVDSMPSTGPMPRAVPVPGAEPVGPAGPAASVETEVGALIVRVAELTREALDEARRQGERIVAEAQAEAASILADAQRQADIVRADVAARDPALRQLQQAIETLERVRYELSQGPGPATGPVPSPPDVASPGNARGLGIQTDAGRSFVNESNRT